MTVANFITNSVSHVPCTGKTGAPDGLIEASEHGYTKDALEKCIKDLESLGIKLSTKKFNDRCAA